MRATPDMRGLPLPTESRSRLLAALVPRHSNAPPIPLHPLLLSRITVSMEDLITDLLSNPVDVSDWVPDWVRDEACARRQAGIAGDASGASLKAHIGIVSSATAILKDLEDRGLLRVGRRGAGEAGPPMRLRGCQGAGAGAGAV